METIVGGLAFLLLPALIPLLLVIGVVRLTKPSQEKATSPNAGGTHKVFMLPSITRSVFDAQTFRSRFLVGTLLGVATVVWFLVIAVVLIAMERIAGDTGGAGGVIGFIVLPIAMLAGAPWSVMLFGQLKADTFLLGVAAGIVINGSIIGFVLGLSCNRSQEVATMLKKLSPNPSAQPDLREMARRFG